MQSDAALLGGIVDNLLGAYLTQRATCEPHGYTLQESRLPGTIRLLGVVVLIIAKYQCCYSLLQRISQRAEGTQILGLYTL